MSEISKTAVAEALNRYCFQYIWNEPTAEGRCNLRPYKLNSRSYSGFCYFGDEAMSLPTRDMSYMVYRFTNAQTHGTIDIPTNIWVNGVDMCNQYDILLHVYTPQGAMAHKETCWLYKDNASGIITLAVRKDMLIRMGNDSNVYITIYADSDIVGNTTIYNDIDMIRYVLQTKDKNKMILFLNGYEYDPTIGYNLYVDNDKIELIYDEDILDALNIPVTTDPHVYFSDKDDLYREIIHIPKSSNPDNKLITYNNCSFYVRDNNHKGTYLHFTSEKTVGQITHNDISIPRYILDAHKDYLNTDIIYLHVKIRTHSKANFHIRDASYIDLLYTLDDATILEHLQGNVSADLDFWKANELEQQEYTKMMFDTPDIITEDTISKYIDTLGYYHTASVIAQRVFTAQVTDATNRSIIFNKPYIWKSVPVYPIVYLNGSKIKHEDISYQNNNNGTVSIRWADSLYSPVGTKITVYYFPLGKQEVYKFVPTEEEYVITIVNKPFKVYERISSLEIVGLYSTSTYGWKEFPVGTSIFVTSENGYKTLLFHSTLYNREFYIVYDDSTRYFRKDLSEDITDNKCLYVDLNVVVTDEEETIPMVNIKDSAVYFNSRYLVKDVDYKLVITPGYNDDIGLVQVIISNMKYGYDDGSPNIVEVIGTSIEVENSDHGFTVNDKVSEDLDVDIWFKNLSIVHINGKYVDDIINTGIRLQLPEGVYANGLIFELKNSIPKEITDVLLPNTPTLDRERISAIEAYFYGVLDPVDEDIILPESHRIYSPYLNFLIQGIINEEIPLAYDPDESNMYEQLVPYNYLKKYDAIFDDPMVLNTRFLDIHPTYVNLVTDIKWRELVRALAALILPTDNYTSGVADNE